MIALPLANTLAPGMVRAHQNLPTPAFAPPAAACSSWMPVVATAAVAASAAGELFLPFGALPKERLRCNEVTSALGADGTLPSPRGVRAFMLGSKIFRQR